MQAELPSLMPPFRVDQVGSLLRPPNLLAARERTIHGEIDPSELRRVEDEAIRAVVALQEEIGLPVVTDGEYRRGLYSDNFTSDALTGVVMDTETGSWRFDDGQKVAPLMRVTDRIRWSGRSTNAADFVFLKDHTARLPKITLPGPAFIHYRAGRANISREIYPDLDRFWADLVEAYGQELATLHAAGCRYVQLDETSLAKFGDPQIQRKLAERGDDWRTLMHVYAEAINGVVAAAPAGMLLAMHLCRGNNRGHWQAEGGYEVVAETLFRELRIPLYLLEFDTPRAGSFEVLRALPKDKGVVLGLVSTKTGAVEDKQRMLARLEEAATHVPLDQLAVSPQCGFASVDKGNPISVDQEIAKLRLCVEIADEVWH